MGLVPVGFTLGRGTVLRDRIVAGTFVGWFLVCQAVHAAAFYVHASGSGRASATSTPSVLPILFVLHIWIAWLLYRSRPAGLWFGGLAGIGYVALGISVSRGDPAPVAAVVPFAFVGGYCIWRLVCPAWEVEPIASAVCTPPPVLPADPPTASPLGDEPEATEEYRDRQMSVVDKLEKLSELYLAGSLTEDEFARGKEILLDKAEGGKQ